MQQVDLQLSRDPYPLPQLKINPEIHSIFDFNFDNFEVCDYQHHAPIKAPVAV
jgi:thymidylate synthase